MVVKKVVTTVDPPLVRVTTASDVVIGVAEAAADPDPCSKR